MEGIVNSKSKTFLIFCSAFIAGIAIESFFKLRIECWILGSAALSGFFIAIIFWKNKNARLVFFMLAFFVLGFWRFEASLPRFDENNIHSFYDKNVVMRGVVITEPDKREDKIKYTLEVKEVEDVGEASGRVLVSMGLFPEFEYGDLIQVKCKIRKPEPISDFRYDNYLGKDKIFSLCYPRGGTLVEGGRGNKFLGAIFFVKNKFQEKTNQIFPEPQASFLAGLLYGARSGLPGEVLDNFSATGVTHIIAISGYNITIVSAIFLIIAYNLGISRKRAFPWVVAAIIIFVIFAGASASVVRAGIMGILVLLAKQTGRSSKIFNVLLFTCALMCMANPWVLIFDAGFQLSFLATIGLVWLAPLIGPWFKRVPTVLGIQESLVATLSATIITLPLIIFQFGRFSLVAPLANILILPAIPITMFLGFSVVGLGFISVWLGNIFSWLPWAILTYMLKVAEIFAKIEFAQIDIPNFNIIFFIGMYGWLLFYIIFGNKKLKQMPIRL